jgi:hypothetical protein
MYCIMLANLAIMRAVSAFPRFLNPDEVTSLVIAVSDETFGFFSEFLAQIDQGGYEKEPLDILLAAWRQMRETARPSTMPATPK